MNFYIIEMGFEVKKKKTKTKQKSTITIKTDNNT